ncbi:MULTISPECIES: hypothetical protein [unclassified Nostoc]|nr:MULTISPECIES: hypothetical protein [unclassified Nostoc]
MKRYGNLWNEIIEFGNLLSAAQQAQRGKRFRENVLARSNSCPIHLILK